MPYDIIERGCTQADGSQGSYVLEKRSSGKQVSCHVSPEAAESARQIRLQAEKSLKVISTPRGKSDLQYDGTEETSWSSVSKTWTEYRDSYYEHGGASRPEDPPETVEAASEDMTAWIASKTILGRASASSVRELIVLPVVNPETNALNAPALRNAISRASQVSGIGADMVEQVQGTLRKLLREEFGSVEDSEKRPSKKASQEEIEERYEEFQSTVNMSASEIETWADNDCSDQASQNPETVRNRVIRLLRTPKDEWGDSEFDAAGRVVSFVSRMRGVEGGDPPSGDCPSKRTISLRNWGFDPGKSVPSSSQTRPIKVMSDQTQTLIAFGGGIKILGSGKQYGKEPNGPRVGGYAVVYTGPDELDLDGQFFSKETDFWLPKGNEGFVWPIYGHGQDPTLRNKRFSSEPWTVKEDDAGLWMEGQLEIADKYDEMILEQGIKPGKMGLSTGALPHLVRVETVQHEGEKVEHIKEWPVYENSITPQPSEWRTKPALETKGGHGLNQLQSVNMPSAKSICTGNYKAQHEYSEGDLVMWEGGSAQGRVVEVSTSGTARGSMEPEGTTHETSEENPGFVIQLVDREDGEIVGRTDGDGNPQTVFHRAGSLSSASESEVSEKRAPEPLKSLASLSSSLDEEIQKSDAAFGLSGVAGNLSRLAKSCRKGTTLGGNLMQAMVQMEEANDDMSRADIVSMAAEEAGISESTVRSIVGDDPEIDCPPMDRLEGFASALDLDVETVVGWAREDGCDYDSE